MNVKKLSDGAVVQITGLESMFNNFYLSAYYHTSLEFIVFNLLSKVGATMQAIVNLYSYD